MAEGEVNNRRGEEIYRLIEIPPKAQVSKGGEKFGWDWFIEGFGKLKVPWLFHLWRLTEEVDRVNSFELLWPIRFKRKNTGTPKSIVL
jgi:hypothetical protein